MKPKVYYDQKIYATNVHSIIEECRDYASQEEDATQKKKYLDDIKEIKANGHDFEQLCNSGIFHDAIGKVLESNESCVTVTIQY